MSDILTKPEWIPYYIQRMKGSQAYRELKDYQFGWYSKLLIELADSPMPGYLPNEVSELWKLAGAQTEYYFRKHGGIELLASRFNRTEDGRWIYNAHMLRVLHEQGKKLTKKRKRCLSSLLSVVQGLPDWIPEEEFRGYMEMREKMRKPLNTPRAVKLLVNKLERLKASGFDPKELLDKATVSNWLSVYAPEEATNGTRTIQQAGKCKIPEHQGSGIGPNGQCWGCYNESPEQTLARIRGKANGASAGKSG